MRNLHKLPRVAAFASVMVFFGQMSFAATPHYAVVDIGSLPGGSSIGRYMNEDGKVVGSSGVLHGNHEHAFLWSASGGMLDLGSLRAGEYSGVFAINRAGDAVGDSNGNESVHAVLWSHTDGMIDLGTLSGKGGSRAFGINDAVEVVGYSSNTSGIRAFIWDKATGMRSLGALPGGNYSEALAINNAGQVVGVSSTSTGKRAFLWSNANGMIDLGVLPGDRSSQALRISQTGAVVGTSVGTPDTVHAFLWTKASGMQNLGLLDPHQYVGTSGQSPGQYAAAMDVNSMNQVVGSSRTPAGARAFLWTKDAGIRDLNTLLASNPGVLLAAALRIDDRGQIVCLGGIHHDLPTGSHELDDEQHAGPSHVFLLTPLPAGDPN